MRKKQEKAICKSGSKKEEEKEKYFWQMILTTLLGILVPQMEFQKDDSSAFHLNWLEIALVLEEFSDNICRYLCLVFCTREK